MKPSVSLSIKQIALALTIGVLVLVGLIGGFAVWQTHAVLEKLDRSHREAARSELAAATERLFRKTILQADRLAHREETRQQLAQPGPYPHWRDQSVYADGLLPGPHARVGLYDLRGGLLAPDPAPLALPEKLPDEARGFEPYAWLARDRGGLAYFQSFPIYDDAQRHQPLGHGLIRVDFMGALLDQEAFHFVEPTRLKLALAPGDRLAPGSLLAHLQFEARTDPNRVRFQAIVSRTLLALFVLLATALILAFAIYNRVLIRPLNQLSRDIGAMQPGPFHPPPGRGRGFHVAELDTIRRSLHDYQLQLHELHGSLEHQNREFRSQARQDALTGCHNRRAYEEDWAAFREEWARAPQGVAFLLFDCDRFKAINDTYGHAKGDRVLMLIADALIMALRANDRLYRLGGDEFAAFLARTTAAQARQIAQRCQSLIEAVAFGDLGISEPVGISIGIAFCGPDPGAGIADLPKQADIAMYTAKQPGRTRIALYGEDTERAGQTLVASRETSALFQALATPGMIEMHYQPIHALPDRRLEYYEALARIRYHGDLILPKDFLPVIASRRLETEFDLAVLHQVDADLVSHRLPEGVGVSINLSAQTLSRAEVVSQLLELSRHNARHPLMLEITETSLITQIAEVSTYLELLRTVHFRIAMDDFGTGYSPLRYLVDLPVDIVKFDISLIGKLAQDNRAARVVADFARMMSDAGYSLVAEGVETEAVLEKVAQLGIRHVQGFLLGRPMPLDSLAGASRTEDTPAFPA